MTAPLDATTSLQAHAGLGNTADLPIPFEAVVIGSVIALAASFAVLALAWRSPRYDGETPGSTRRPGRPAPAWIAAVADSTALALVARIAGLAFFAFMVFALVAGQDYVTNPGLGMFYALLWVGIVPASLLFGRFYRAVSPARAIQAGLARLAGQDPSQGVRTLPDWVGYWPAALGLYAFVWHELVSSSATDIGAVRLWIVVYLGLMLVGGAIFGDVFFARADPFEVYSTLVAHLSPWARDDDGRLMVRSPLANLASMRPRPGLVAVVAVLFGSTAFDSFRESPVFVRFVYSSTIDSDLLLNISLLAICLAVGVLLSLAAAATGATSDYPRRTLPGLMAHSIVPIIVGYIAAHYVTLLFEHGQQVVVDMSDPLSNGSDWFGTADLQPAYFLSSNSTLLAAIQVGGVVIGHIVAAVAAHDRALAVLPRRHQLSGQLPMLAVMIAFTAGGLYLLFAS